MRRSSGFRRPRAWSGDRLMPVFGARVAGCRRVVPRVGATRAHIKAGPSQRCRPRPEIRHLRVSPCRRPRRRRDRQSETPAFARQRVRATACDGTERGPRFHTARGLLAEIGKDPRFATSASLHLVDLLVLAADGAEDLQIAEAGAGQPQIGIVARPASCSYEGRRRRHRTAGASPVFARTRAAGQSLRTGFCLGTQAP